MIVADGKQLSKAITTSLIKKTICIFVVSYLKTKSYEKNNRTVFYKRMRLANHTGGAA